MFLYTVLFQDALYLMKKVNHSSINITSRIAVERYRQSILLRELSRLSTEFCNY